MSFFDQFFNLRHLERVEIHNWFEREHGITLSDVAVGSSGQLCAWVLCSLPDGTEIEINERKVYVMRGLSISVVSWKEKSSRVETLGGLEGAESCRQAASDDSGGEAEEI